MKNTRKLISLLLVMALLLTTAVTTVATAGVVTGTLASHYQTNPGGGVGKSGSITIDGSFSDWTEDMLVATSAAWDCANHWKGAHENCLIDAYALFACWDSSNLYIGMQYVNTTDTWQNAGDASLMDGGKMGDLHLVLALSVNSSNPGLNGKVTSGDYIWGDKINYSTHVDHLFYMSTKPGLGTPGHFTAADASGNTDYTSHCANFKTQGIEYKMADGNACSSIWGLNDSNDPSDVCSDSADWVDYKTYRGSKGAHDTKYDSFYEIKIPFSALGITASDLTSKGIGAMTLCGRGESALDCCPFDLSMVDNVKGDYASDPSTSHEKDDTDEITVPLASIGKGGTYVPPVTQAPTVPPVEPTTAAPQPTTVDPVSNETVVNATSNILSGGSVTASGNTVTVTYKLQSGMELVNGQWSMTYDTSKLRLKTDKSALMPNISGTTNIYNNTAYGTFSNIDTLYNFTTAQPFVQAEFEVIGKGTANVNLNIEELSVGYKSGGVLNFENAVSGGVKKNITASGFSANSISGTAEVINGQPTTETKLTVNATSNFFPSASKVITQTGSQVTVEYLFKSTHDLLNSEWTLTYDTAKLKYNSTATGKIMPYANGASAQETTQGRIKGANSSTSPSDFTSEKAFVRVTFDTLAFGTANVNLNVEILGLVNDNEDPGYLVDAGVVKNLKSQSGFSGLSYTTNTKFGSGVATPAITVKATSNYFPTAERLLSTDSSQVTVAFKVSSYYELINAQWELTYDTSKLRFNKSDLNKLQPHLGSSQAQESNAGKIKGNFSNTATEDFLREKDFVTVTFDVVGTGETTVNFNILILGVVNDEGKTGYAIDNGTDQKLNQKAGFSKSYVTPATLVIPSGDADRVAGDVNFDGALDITDATYIQRHSAEFSLFNADQMDVADVNKDGAVDVTDATMVQRIIAR